MVTILLALSPNLVMKDFFALSGKNKKTPFSNNEALPPLRKKLRKLLKAIQIQQLCLHC